jgi:hypothetical protein
MKMTEELKAKMKAGRAASKMTGNDASNVNFHDTEKEEL